MPEFYSQFGLRCLPAPNRYRKMLASSLAASPPPGETRYGTVRDAVIERMSVEYPAMARPLGLDIDPRSGDTILIWEA